MQTGFSAVPLVALLVLLAGVLAWPLTRVLLARYRRAVVRMMQHRDAPRFPAPIAPPRAGHAVAAVPGSLVVPAPPAPAAPPPAVPAPTNPFCHPSLSSGEAATRARAHQRRLRRRYDLAGAVAAAVLTAATLAAIGSPPLPVRTTLVLLVLAWPAVLAVHVLEGYRWGPVVRRAAVYAAVVVGIGVVWGAR